MAWFNEQNVTPLGCLCASGNSISINTFVKQDTGNGSPYVVQSTAATDLVIGVALNKTDGTSLQSVAVQTDGVAKVVAGGAITYGQQVMSGAGGKAYALSGATSIICGIAMDAASGNAIVIPVKLLPSTAVNA